MNNAPATGLTGLRCGPFVEPTDTHVSATAEQRPGSHGGQAGAGAFNTAGRRLLMAEEGHVLGDAMIPGDGQCANGRIGAYCTECPEGQNTTAEGCE